METFLSTLQFEAPFSTCINQGFLAIFMRSINMMKAILEGGLNILKLSLIREYQSQFNKAIFCA